MKNVKVALFLIISIVGYISQAREQYGLTPDQLETARWSFEKAQHFSGIVSKEPVYDPQKLPIFLMSEDEMSAEVCPDDPQNCRGLAGLFETKRKVIFLRSSLDPDQDLISASYLIHEMVHSLQNETRSQDTMFGTCEKLYATEKEAYDVQDAFLKSEGQFFRAGNYLRFFHCDN